MGDYLVTGYPHVAGYPTTVYPHDRPPSWETNPQQATLRRLPCNGLPLWETAVWQTTHIGDNPMTGYPHWRLSYNRLPSWQTTLVGDYPVTDYPHGRQPYDRLPSWKATLISWKAILQQTAIMIDCLCWRQSMTDCHHERQHWDRMTVWRTTPTAGYICGRQPNNRLHDDMLHSW